MFGGVLFKRFAALLPLAELSYFPQVFRVFDPFEKFCKLADTENDSVRFSVPENDLRP